MIVRDPAARWSAEILKTHEYFFELDWNAIETKDYKRV